MRCRYGLAVVWACLMTAGFVHAGAPDGPRRARYVPAPAMVYSPNAFKITYLGLDGVFTIDPKEIPATDPRNPPRVVFRKTDSQSSFRRLLQMSNGSEDNTKLDPWWSVYCAEGVSGCDE